MAQLLKYFVKVRASLSSSYNQKSFESGILSANILERASIQFEAMNVVITTWLFFRVIFPGFTSLKLESSPDLKEYLGIAVPASLSQLND